MTLEKEYKVDSRDIKDVFKPVKVEVIYLPPLGLGVTQQIDEDKQIPEEDQKDKVSY